MCTMLCLGLCVGEEEDLLTRSAQHPNAPPHHHRQRISRPLRSLSAAPPPARVRSSHGPATSSAPRRHKRAVAASKSLAARCAFVVSLFCCVDRASALRRQHTQPQQPTHTNTKTKNNRRACRTRLARSASPARGPASTAQTRASRLARRSSLKSATSARAAATVRACVEGAAPPRGGGGE